MKKISIILILFCFLISCEKKKPNFSKEMINVLADRGEIQDNGVVKLPPPPVTFLNIYIRINDNEILLSSSRELLFFYKDYYSTKFDSYEDFLDTVLNQNFVLDKKMLKKPTYLESFKLNSNTEKEYADLGFDSFLKKYSKETVAKRLALNRKIVKEGEYSTIVYILFKNGYDISSDCYLGIDYIRKREDSFK
ncbi:hypothetical protein [Flavobacterium sp. LAR06]|uniref:hypothetical protein n=1 Tax=Flavobacterium sp. LAR06 TaxID=3064897 RepID=UPI0035C10383